MTAKRQGFTAVALVAGLRDFYKALLDGSELPPAEFDKLVDENAARITRAVGTRDQPDAQPSQQKAGEAQPARWSVRNHGERGRNGGPAQAWHDFPR